MRHGSQLWVKYNVPGSQCSRDTRQTLGRIGGAVGGYSVSGIGFAWSPVGLWDFIIFETKTDV